MTAKVISFPGAKTRKKIRAKRKTLCKSGFHKWAIDKQQEFDVRHGRLVTVETCSRCGVTRRVLT